MTTMLSRFPATKTFTENMEVKLVYPHLPSNLNNHPLNKIFIKIKQDLYSYKKLRKNAY